MGILNRLHGQMPAGGKNLYCSHCGRDLKEYIPIPFDGKLIKICPYCNLSKDLIVFVCCHCGRNVKTYNVIKEDNQFVIVCPYCNMNQNMLKK